MNEGKVPERYGGGTGVLIPEGECADCGVSLPLGKGHIGEDFKFYCDEHFKPKFQAWVKRIQEEQGQWLEAETD